jgi:hypothetical protein
MKNTKSSYWNAQIYTECDDEWTDVANLHGLSEEDCAKAEGRAK